MNNRKSPKNHLNLTLPSPTKTPKTTGQVSIVPSPSNKTNIKSNNTVVTAQISPIPSIVHHEPVSHDKSVENSTDIQKLDTSLLIPKVNAGSISIMTSPINMTNSSSTINDISASNASNLSLSSQAENLVIKKLQDFEKSIEIQEGLTKKQRQKLVQFQQLKLKQIGDLIPDSITILEELGKGNGGVVTKVIHKPSNQIMARKNIHLEIKAAIRTQIMRELQVLHECHSPYIVGYYGSYHQEVEISICMEYMDGGSLDVLLLKAGRFPEPVISHITYAVVKGLIYLRKNLRIIHRDVKPSNILVNMAGEVKLCDFGVSGRLIDSMANSFVGTRSYMAPERLTGEQYNTLSDVWSLGLSLTELATGVYPIPTVGPENFLVAFSRKKSDNFQQHIRAADEGVPLPRIQASDKGPMAIFELLSYIVDFPSPTLPQFCFSANFLSFLDHCLRKQPGDRLNLETLLKHRFLVEDSRQNLLTQAKCSNGNGDHGDKVAAGSTEVLTAETMMGNYVEKMRSYVTPISN